MAAYGTSCCDFLGDIPAVCLVLCESSTRAARKVFVEAISSFKITRAIILQIDRI